MLLVCISKRHFPSLPHVVLQILPAHSTGQIFNNDAEFRPDRGSVPLCAPPRTVLVSASSSTTPAVSVTVVITYACWASRMFDDNSFSTHFFAIQFIDSIICISVVLKFNKTKSILQVDFSYPAEPSEEPFYISVSGLVA